MGLEYSWNYNDQFFYYLYLPHTKPPFNSTLRCWVSLTFVSEQDHFYSTSRSDELELSSISEFVWTNLSVKERDKIMSHLCLHTALFGINAKWIGLDTRIINSSKTRE